MKEKYFLCVLVDFLFYTSEKGVAANRPMLKATPNIFPFLRFLLLYLPFQCTFIYTVLSSHNSQKTGVGFFPEYSNPGKNSVPKDKQSRENP